MSGDGLPLGELPERAGPRPKVYPGPPQSQLDQHPDSVMWRKMRDLLEGWPGCKPAPSRRAAPGTQGLFVEDAPRSRDPEHFLIGHEFAHHHPDTDGGLHLVLPDDAKAEAMEKGWAQPHTWAGRPTVSANTLLVYAPRDDAELDVVRRLIAAAEAWARTE